VASSQKARIGQRIDALRAVGDELEAAAVISLEGLVLAASLPEELAEERLAAMTAAMLALGERIAAELARGALEQIYIKGAGGYVLLLALNETAALTALAGAEANLGLLFLDMRQAAADLQQWL